MSYPIRIFALGGLDENGKCMLVMELGDDLFIVEGGLKYPDRNNPGIDAIIPNIDYLIKNRSRIRAIIITHGHDDQFGAIPYIYHQLQAPIYASKATAALLQQFTIQQTKLHPDYQFNIILPTSSVTIAGHHFEFFQTVHAVMDSSGFAVSTPYGNIVYSGDFIVEYNANKNYKHDLNAIARIAEKETLLLLTESIGAEKTGYTSPNHRLANHLVVPFQEAQGRIFVALYNQGVYNLEELLKFVFAQGKKIVFYDFETEDYIKTFTDIGSISIPKDKIISRENHLRAAIKEQVIIMMATGEDIHKKIAELAERENKDRTFELHDQDTFIVAAPSAPAIEVMAYDALDQLYRTGAKVVNITRKQISSMHAQEEDLKTFISLLKPKYYMPIKGEYVQLYSNAKLAVSMGLGLNHTNTFLMDNGQVLEFKEGKGKVHTSPLDKIHVGDVLIDGLGVGDVRSEVIRQRQQLSQDGILIIGVTISRFLKKIVAGPDVQMRGFIFIKDAESFNRELQTLLNTEIQDFLVNRGTLPLEKYKELLIEKVLKLTKRLTGKTPVVMPILVNVDQRADASK